MKSRALFVMFFISLSFYSSSNIDEFKTSEHESLPISICSTEQNREVLDSITYYRDILHCQKQQLEGALVDILANKSKISEIRMKRKEKELEIDTMFSRLISDIDSQVKKNKWKKELHHIQYIWVASKKD